MRRRSSRSSADSLTLAPGRLPDRVANLAREADPRIVLAEPLGPDQTLAELVLDRYAEVAAVRPSLRYA